MVVMKGRKMECGSPVSNTLKKNEAVLNATLENRTITLEEVNEIGYPFRDSFECYTTWTMKKLLKKTINETSVNGTIIERDYDEPIRSVSIGRGLLNTYDGKGHTKIIPLNITNNNHFFYQAYK